MRRHLNTLYVTTQGAWLNKDGENVVVSLDGAERGRVPIHGIGAIVCFGRVLVSPPLMGAAAEAGIRITHLTEEGRFLARIEGPVSGNVLLRRTQYRWADDPARCVSIVRSFVAGKLLNQRAVPAHTRARVETSVLRRARDAARVARSHAGVGRNPLVVKAQRYQALS